MGLLIYLFLFSSIPLTGSNFNFNLTDLEFTLSHRDLFIKTSYLIKIAYLLSSWGKIHRLLCHRVSKQFIDCF